MRIFWYLVDIAIPVMLAYLATKNTLFIWLTENNLLPQNFNVALCQEVCLFLNIAFTTFVLNSKLLYQQCKGNQYKKEIAGLFNIIKEVARNNFVDITKNKDFSFDLRIFVLEISIINVVISHLGWKREKWFVIRNIEPFAKKDVTEHLRFRVYPNPQGIVGKVYQSGDIVYDDQLQKTNSQNYALDHSQINRTSNLLWSICVPIVSKGKNVIAIVAFDSDRSKLDISKNKEKIRTLTNTITLLMYDSTPELFARKWSLL